MNSIEWTRKAEKQLSRIDRNDQKTIVLAVGELSGFPKCVNVKRLGNHPYEYRLRVGRYRVFFDFHSMVKIIRIEEVKKRDERTY